MFEEEGFLTPMLINVKYINQPDTLPFLKNNQSIVVKSLRALPAHPTSINHLLQQSRRPILAIASLGMQHIHNGQAGIQTNEIS